MTTGDYSPLLRDGGGRASGAQHHQVIDAHYYNITDLQSWPIAGLLVLLDGRKQPVRAELQIDSELDDFIVEAAVREARVVLQDQYIGGEPVPMTIVTTDALRDAIDVYLPPLGSRARPQDAQRKRFLIGGGILAALVLVAVLLFAIMRPGAAEQAASAPPVATAASQVDAADQSVAEMEIGDAEVTGATPAPLPTSRNARSDINIGMRVTVVPTLQVALRSHPNVDSGTSVGALTDGVVATVIDGPRYTQGLRDTIVWWYVELDSGVQAWAASNTSDQTLLIPAN